MSKRSHRSFATNAVCLIYGLTVISLASHVGAAEDSYSLYAESGCPEREALVITPRSSLGLPDGMYASEETVTVCRRSTGEKCDGMSEYWNFLGHAIADDPNGCISFVFPEFDVYLMSMPICDCVVPQTPHPLDANENWRIELGEVLRLVQFHNSDGFHCEPSTEDGYGVGPGSTDTCEQHLADYEIPTWRITLSEVLRAIQFYNSNGYFQCFETSDSYCPIGYFGN